MSKIESTLDTLMCHVFPAQLPTWFRRIVARWSWWLLIPVIVVQPWVSWGYWDAGAAHGSVRNTAFALSLVITGIEVCMQLLAIPALKHFKRRGWELVYYSVFINLLYGVVHIFSSVKGGIGPLCGMVLLSTLFFYVLFQIRSSFKS